MGYGIKAIGWLSWKAADLTAWIFEATPEPTNRVFDLLQGWTYRLYNWTARFAFWFDERHDLGEVTHVQGGE